MRRKPGANGILVAVSLIVVGYLLTFAYLRGGASGEGVGAPPGGAESGNPSRSAGRFLGRSDLLDGTSFAGAGVGGLSALAYDPRRDLYYAPVDRRNGEPARYYSIRLPLDETRLGRPEIFDVTILRDDEGKAFGAGRLDGEGIAVTSWGELLVASEVGPRILRFALDGRLLGDLEVPGKFLISLPEGGEPDSSLEGLTLTPDSGTMFAAPQRALGRDRSDDDTQGRRIRLLRYEIRGTEDPAFDGEFFYLADSEGGVADVAAVSGDDLLMLEHGNEVFRVDVSGARDVSGVESLASSGAGPLRKELVVDLDDCASAGGPGNPPAYEGLALGPGLPGGGRALLFLSDDNFDEGQTTSVAAISLASNPDVGAGPVCR